MTRHGFGSSTNGGLPVPLRPVPYMRETVVLGTIAGIFPGAVLPWLTRPRGQPGGAPRYRTSGKRTIDGADPRIGAAARLERLTMG